MVLYQKVMKGKRTTYEAIELEHRADIEQDQMVTLLTALSISMLMSVEKQLPRHTLLARKISKVEEAIKDMAQLVAKPLDPALIEHGILAWNSAINSMQRTLGGQHA